MTPLAWVMLVVFLAAARHQLSSDRRAFCQVHDAVGRFGPIQGYFSSPFIPLSLLLICPALPMPTVRRGA